MVGGGEVRDLGRGGGHVRRGLAEYSKVFGVPDQVVAEGLADAENGDQRGAQGLVVAEPAPGAGDPAQAGQRQVGIGGGRERGEQVFVGFRVDRGVREQQLGAGRIGEPHPGQPPCQRRTPHAGNAIVAR